MLFTTVSEGRATGVRLANGQHLEADIVVSNGDTAWTYKHLIKPEHRRHWTDRRVEGGRVRLEIFQDHGSPAASIRKGIAPPTGCPSAEMIRHSTR